MDYNTQPTNNLDRLKQAGITNKEYVFSEDDQAIIDSLSEDEVDSLIALADKLGRDFLRHHGGQTGGILF
jgi:hypothetical protein